MINKRLINTVKDSKKYIFSNVLCQWVSLLSNFVFVTCLALMIEKLWLKEQFNIFAYLIYMLISILVRAIMTKLSIRMGYLASKEVKKVLREKIYQKLLSLQGSYKEQINTSELVQIAVEGVDQLEVYFSSYLPQFFYAMLAPLSLFIYLSFIDIKSAIVLFICVPLIPVSIIIVQKWAKKLLSKYWGQYTALGDTFLENLQGLTTLKVYQSDQYKNEKMNEEAEKFRVVTMKVLTMQLNSITIMDLVAYGGSALGIIVALLQLNSGNIGLFGCLLIILLSAEFFIPMRQLGSFFHIAMNGMAASDKIFRFLDLQEPKKVKTPCPDIDSISIKKLSFSYDENKEILHNVSLNFSKGSFSAIVGESGSGKSTISSILMKRNRKYTGHVLINNIDLNQISESSLMENITYVSHQSYLFKGTIKDNLLIAKPDASDEELWNVLNRAKLSAFLKQENGLETFIEEKGSNFSGGQCQRLAFARALLHDSPVYIFDEATSNIDVESENDIMQLIHELANEKTVILISHRLANVKDADTIYVLENGNIVESGKHEKLLQNQSVYASLWNAQVSLESYIGGGNA